MEGAASDSLEVSQKDSSLCALSPAKNPRSEEGAVERRNFLGALTAASIGVLLESSLAQLARAQNSKQIDTQATPPISFETSQVQVSGNRLVHSRKG